MSTASIKFGVGFDAPWVVIEEEGEQALRRQLAKAFGLDDSEDKTLAELTVEATLLAHAMYAAAKGLDAKPAKQSGATSTKVPTADAASVSVTDHVAAINKLTRVDDLKAYYVKHESAFADDPDLLAAYKAKGKELTSK